MKKSRSIDFCLNDINKVLYRTVVKSMGIFYANTSKEALEDNVLLKISEDTELWESLIRSEFVSNGIISSDKYLWGCCKGYKSVIKKGSMDKQRFIRVHFRCLKSMINNLNLQYMANLNTGKEPNYAYSKKIMSGNLVDNDVNEIRNDIFENPSIIRQMVDDHSYLIRHCCLMNYSYLKKELSGLLNDLSRSLIFSESSADFERIFLFYLRRELNAIDDVEHPEQYYSGSEAIHKETSEKLGFVLTWLLLSALLQDNIGCLISYSDNICSSIFDKSKISYLHSEEAANKDSLYLLLKERNLTIQRDHPSFIAINRINEVISRSLMPRPWISIESSMFKAISDEQGPDANPESLGELFSKCWGRNRIQNISLVGEGGIGKTVALLSLGTDESINVKKIPVLYIPLRDLNGYEDSSSELSVLDRWMINEFGQSTYNLIIERANKIDITGPAIILLLDGFNELSDNRKVTLAKAVRHWVQKPRIQIVTTSRSEVNLGVTFSHFHLLPLDTETVQRYLADHKIKIKSSDSGPLMEVLKTPLMLHLYIHSYSYINSVSDDIKSKLIWKKPSIARLSAADLMWNAVQTELAIAYDKYGINNKSEIPFAEYIFSILITIPYICWRMVHEKNYTRSVTEEQIFEWINDLFQEPHMQEDQLEFYPQLKNLIKRGRLGGVIKTSTCSFDCDYQYSVITSSDILLHKNGSSDYYDLPHQNYRDFLAAVHILNAVQRFKISVEKTRPEEKALPQELKETNQDVLKYLSDIIDSATVKFLWERCRKPVNNTFAGHILGLYALRKEYDFKNLDFSGHDLTNINLNKYRKPGKNRLLLPADPDLLKGTKISRASFDIVGHTRAITSVIITEELYCISIDANGRLLLWYLPDLSCILNHDLGVPSNDWALFKADNAIFAHCPESKPYYRIDTKEKKVVQVSYADAGKLFEDDYLVENNVWALSDEAVSQEEPYADSGEIITGRFKSPVTNTTVVFYSSGKVAVLADNIPIYTFTGFTVSATALDFYGPYCACGSADGTVRVWDLRYGTCEYTIYCDPGWINSTVVTKDKILTGGSDNVIRVWDKQTHQLLQVYEGHEDWVNSLSTNEKNEIISASGDGTIRVWGDNIEPQILRGHTSWVRMIKCLGNSGILSSSDDGAVRYWDIKSGDYHDLINDSRTGFRCFDISPNQDLIIAGSNAGKIYVWSIGVNKDNTPAFTLLSEIPVRQNVSINSLSFSFDGTCFTSGDSGGTIKIWTVTPSPDSDTVVVEETRSFESGKPVQSLQMIWTNDQYYVIAGLKNGSIIRIEAKTGAQTVMQGYKAESIRNITTNDNLIYISMGKSTVLITDYDLNIVSEIKTLNGFILDGVPIDEMDIADDSFRAFLKANTLSITDKIHDL